MFRRMLYILLLPAMLVASIAVSQAAQAQSPHFVGSQSCVSSTSGSVTCSFSVSGLGNAQTATASIQSPFECVKITSHEVRPGGLASSGNQTFAVRAGRIDVSGLQLTASCPDSFAPDFTGPVTVIVNGQAVGTIPIT